LSGDFVTYLPGYRPLPYLELWVEQHVFGWQVARLFLGNLVLLWLATTAVYGLAVAAGARWVAAVAAAALLFLLDPRTLWSIMWIGERQSTLALALGGAALAIALRRDASGREPLVIFGLLVGASTSKEFGIAFAFGVVAVALLGPRAQRARLAAAGAGAFVVYLAARGVLAGFSLEGFCQTMGFPNEEPREVCYADVSASERREQHAWNAFATLVGVFFPGLFDGVGTPLFAWNATGARVPLWPLLVPTAVAALVAYATVRRPREILPLLVVVAANAVLSVAVYRTRNQLAGVAAVSAAAAVGATMLLQAPWVRRCASLAPAAMPALALAALAVAAELAVSNRAAGVVARLNPAPDEAQEACAALAEYPRDISPDVVARVHGIDCPEPKPAAQSPVP
jgi:hypothetical protein